MSLTCNFFHLCDLVAVKTYGPLCISISLIWKSGSMLVFKLVWLINYLVNLCINYKKRKYQTVVLRIRYVKRAFPPTIYHYRCSSLHYTIYCLCALIVSFPNINDCLCVLQLVYVCTGESPNLERAIVLIYILSWGFFL